MKASKNAEEQLGYNKQVVDSLVAALRTGHYPEGRKPLEAIIDDGGKLASYAAYSLIDAEFAMKNDEPGANVLANQKKWMADLEDFLEKFPDSDEAAPVLFHLANANEFNAEEDKAREQYGKLVKDYAATDAGKKAAGALRRLDLAGKPLADQGDGPAERDGRFVAVSRQAGLDRLLGELGHAGQARPARADQALRQAQEGRLRDHRRQSRQRARRARRLPQGTSDHLAADLRGRRHGQPPGGRLRHHPLADDVPGRCRGQSGEPKPANLGRGRPPARKDARGETGQRGD